MKWFPDRFAFFQLLKRDLQERYLGSNLGFVWSFIQQSAMILVIAFVLENGLRVPAMSDVPFIAWLVPAQALWIFFSEALSSTGAAFVSFGYLVKKLSFRVSLLPVVKLASALVNHLFFLLVTVVILLFCGVQPSAQWLQIPYYLASALALLWGMGWFLASVSVFFRDTTQILAIVLNFAMWVTPIFWDGKRLGPEYQFLVWVNPVSYLTEGYRASWLGTRWVWEDPLWTLYFWGVTIVFWVLALITYRRLRPHFADVL